MSCLTSSYGFCACWYNLCFFPKPWHWEHFTAFFRPWQNAVESLWLGGMCSSLNCWPGMSPGLASLPTATNSPCPLLRRTIPLFLVSGAFPPAAQEAQEWNRPCWSHTEITVHKVKSCRCLFSNVQSKQCWEDRKGLCLRSKVDFCAFSQDSLHE